MTFINLMPLACGKTTNRTIMRATNNSMSMVQMPDDLMICRLVFEKICHQPQIYFAIRKFCVTFAAADLEFEGHAGCGSGIWTG